MLLAAGGFAAAYWYSHREPPQQKAFTAPSTKEFVPTQKPVKKRPKKVVLTEPWPTYGFNIQRTHLADFRHRPPYQKLWTASSEGLIEFPPIVAYDRVYLAQEFGRFFAYDAKTGKVLWRKKFGHCAASSPTVADGVVYQAYMQPFPCERGNRNDDIDPFARELAGIRLQLWHRAHPQIEHEAASGSARVLGTIFEEVIVGSGEVTELVPREGWRPYLNAALIKPRVLSERKTGLEPATPTLARLCSTN